MISFVNSKDDSPVYNICIFTYLNIIQTYIYVYILYINIINMFTQLQGLPQKKDVDRFCTVHILDLSLHWENIFRRRFHPLKIQLLSQRSWSKKKTRLHPRCGGGFSKTEKDVPNPRWFGLPKNPEKKWLVWNVSTTTIRLGWFQIFCFECSTSSTLGKWSKLTEHMF